MKLTPKEKVKRHYPGAYCKGYAGRRFISFHVMNGENTIGIGDTVRGAWKDAATSLRRVDSAVKAAK